MRKRSKKYVEALSKFDKNTLYSKEEACKLVKDTSTTKFDSSVEVAVRLNLDTKKADQQLRGAIVLPNGTGKSARVLVLAKGDAAKKAKEAGESGVLLFFFHSHPRNESSGMYANDLDKKTRDACLAKSPNAVIGIMHKGFLYDFTPYRIKWDGTGVFLPKGSGHAEEWKILTDDVFADWESAAVGMNHLMFRLWVS